MKFMLLLVLDKIEKRYNILIGQERFQAYLTLLKRKAKDDIVLPIGRFNPMTEPQVLEKLSELKALIASQTLAFPTSEMAGNKGFNFSQFEALNQREY
jgi:hypothetical protein